jgi:integration host factor subunit alpha
VTKADIVNKFSDLSGFSKKDCADILESPLEIIKNTLESGETLKINGFGSFVVKQKTDRRGRNPQTGESITISPRKVLSFKFSPLLRQAINVA